MTAVGSSSALGHVKIEWSCAECPYSTGDMELLTTPYSHSMIPCLVLEVHFYTLRSMMYDKITFPHSSVNEYFQLHQPVQSFI